MVIRKSGAWNQEGEKTERDPGEMQGHKKGSLINYKKEGGIQRIK